MSHASNRKGKITTFLKVTAYKTGVGNVCSVIGVFARRILIATDSSNIPAQDPTFQDLRRHDRLTIV